MLSSNHSSVSHSGQWPRTVEDIPGDDRSQDSQEWNATTVGGMGKSEAGSSSNSSSRGEGDSAVELAGVLSDETKLASSLQKVPSACSNSAHYHSLGR